jgi:hypothetical protein
MPLKGKGVDLTVLVPSSRVHFGGGIDNPSSGEGIITEQTSSGAIRSGERRKARQSVRRRDPFAGINKPEKNRSSPGHIPAYDRIDTQLGLPNDSSATDLAGQPTTGLSGSLGALAVATDGPVSTRTRLRRKLGFPLPPTGALAVLERSEADKASERLMARMSVAAAKQRGAADAEAAAAAFRSKAQARLTRASISKWMNLPNPSRDVAGPREGPSASAADLSHKAKGRLAMLPERGGRRHRVVCDDSDSD